MQNNKVFGRNWDSHRHTLALDLPGLAPDTLVLLEPAPRYSSLTGTRTLIL